MVGKLTIKNSASYSMFICSFETCCMYIFFTLFRRIQLTHVPLFIEVVVIWREESYCSGRGASSGFSGCSVLVFLS